MASARPAGATSFIASVRLPPELFVPEQSSRRAIFAVLLSMAAYVVGDVVLKLLGRSFPPSELIFWRSVVITVSLGAVLVWTQPRPLSTNLVSGAVLARCLFDCINILSFTTAVVHMKLAELYAVLQVAPFIMTIIAVVVFKENVGWRRWSVIAIGFCGVLLIIKPDPGNLNPWALLGIVAAFAGACRETVTRRIDPRVSTLNVAFVSALVTAIGTFAFGYGEIWQAMSYREMMLLLIQAAAWLIGTFLLVHACRTAPLSLVASFRYSLLVWGAIAGYLVFGELPDLLAACGGAIIVLCGLYLFYREAVRNRALASEVTTVT